ncbi:hypothetical protein H2201_005772 [Coniosporium apollinis]|uniref:Uncharacterized protein n=1 Tax=Coniosporium apollinis TaxID=61459 RepID=A0ABQ9NNT4_9PEZI|nr:hypothetical protein H2201_005772 [Coniosporium apollinis]
MSKPVITVTSTEFVSPTAPTPPTISMGSITTSVHEPDASSTASTTSSIPSPSSGPTGTYLPPVPTSYAECLFDPYKGSQTIELIDVNTGVSFVNVGGRAALAMDRVDNGLTTYHLVAPANGPSGVFDLVSDSGKYVAVFEDGQVGFVDESSNGQNQIVDGSGAKYLTTVWSVTCDGELVAGILGGSQLQLGLIGNALYAQSTSPAIRKRQLLPILSIKVVIFPLELRTRLGQDQPRCPNPELNAVDKWGARKASANGCGSQGFMYNHVPFVGCCNDHDYCFDNCERTFKDCNSKFADCMTKSCTDAYPSSSLDSLVKRLGCNRLAASFAWIVDNEIGRAVFNIANKERCACCKPGEKSCQSGCADLLNDPNNCGTCGNVCPSGHCQNGACSDLSCQGTPTYCDERPVSCGADGSCYCFTTIDGMAFCAGPSWCPSSEECASNADCKSGSVCVTNSCCALSSVCVDATCGNPVSKLAMLTRRGKFGGSSTAFKGTWGE